MREGFAEQRIAIRLLARDVSGREEQRDEAVRRRLPRQGLCQDVRQFAQVRPRQGRVETGRFRAAGNRERFAGDEGAGVGHDEIQRPRADGSVHDEQRAVAGAEQQDAAREPRLDFVDARPDAVAAGQDPHGLRFP